MMTGGLRLWWRRLSVSPLLIGLTRRRVAFQWRARGRPLPPPHVVKQLAILGYQRARRFRTLIETGTFTGEMVDAMRPHFDRIISIEMSPQLYEAVSRRLAGDARILLVRGDSATELPRVLEALDHPALFWLDGHFMGAGTARAKEDSPVRAELGALLRHPVCGHLILIDDARLFRGMDGYPALSELEAWIARERPGSRVDVRDDIIRCSLDAEDAVS
jgi:hypothetical protein